MTKKYLSPKGPHYFQPVTIRPEHEILIVTNIETEGAFQADPDVNLSDFSMDEVGLRAVVDRAEGVVVAICRNDDELNGTMNALRYAERYATWHRLYIV
jgi:hypothetical protein